MSYFVRFLGYISENTKHSAGTDRVFEEKRCEYNLLLDRKVNKNVLFSYKKWKPFSTFKHLFPE